MLKYFLLWFPMLIIAIMNGLLRELFIKKYTGELSAHQLSTLTLVIFFALYINFVVIKLPPASSKEAMLVGCMWLVLTLAFEFGFGRWRGNSWETLLAEYNLAKARLWILVPIWIGVAPYFFFRRL
jgi:hypothetical protein